MKKGILQWILAAVFLVFSSAAVHAAAFDINLNLSGFNTSQQSLIYDAEAYWESVIVEYQSGITITSLDITMALTEIDGEYGTLGTGGPTGGLWEGGFLVATDGAITFDSADIDRLTTEQLYSVILHEMAHVIGFGTLWTQNGVYVEGSGQYTGAAALAAYQAEFDPSATYVPVELGGSEGTANGHWDEDDNGISDTGITDLSGNDMRYELMTGWLNTPVFVSDTTLASFEDIGYVLAQVPVPSSIFLLLSGLLGFAFHRRQRQ